MPRRKRHRKSRIRVLSSAKHIVKSVGRVLVAGPKQLVHEVKKVVR